MPDFPIHDWSRDERNQLADDLWASVGPRLLPALDALAESRLGEIEMELNRLRSVLGFVKSVLGADFDLAVGDPWRKAVSVLEHQLERPSYPLTGPPATVDQEWVSVDDDVIHPSLDGGCPCRRCNIHGGAVRNWRSIQWVYNYAEFRNSSKWTQLRNSVLLRAEGLCERCHRRQPRDVHHRTYDRVGGRELLTDLIALCRECHDEVHDGSDKDPAAGRLPPWGYAA